MSKEHEQVNGYHRFGWVDIIRFLQARELEGLEADKSYSGSGWGHGIRRQIARVLNVDENISSIIGAGINSILQSDQVNVTGDALEKIKKDPAISQMENEYLRDIGSGVGIYRKSPLN